MDAADGEESLVVGEGVVLVVAVALLLRMLVRCRHSRASRLLRLSVSERIGYRGGRC